MRITRVEVYDVRFPTSRDLAGSDAMNPDPDYSLAYVVLSTDDAMGLRGQGFAFTIGRGTEIVVEAIRSYGALVAGRSLEELVADLGAFSRLLTNDSQLRWLGPEKGVVQMAASALLNAVWDLYAKVCRQPLWKLLSDMTPAELTRCIDFRYITDFLTPAEAVARLEPKVSGRREREQLMRREGYPAYTTSVGWYGYDDERVRALVREGVAQGWTHFKIKVGRDLDHDRRRVALVREEIGPDRTLMLDANQVWDVPEAIAYTNALATYRPLWMEEPTSPDDVLGYAAIAQQVAPVRLAGGEHCQNRIVFKQLLQLGALGFCQLDACRLGGVNEVLAVMLMAEKAGVPVCPHAGGVGLPEYVQHLALFDYIAVSASLVERTLEYVDHLHEHFVHPAVVRQGRYQVPMAPGYSAELKPSALLAYQFPGGAAWQTSPRP
jgi:L-fuconate dehydratase